MSSRLAGQSASIDAVEKRAPLIVTVFATTALLALIAAMAAPQHGLIILLSAAFLAMSGVTACLAGRLGTEFATIRPLERDNILHFLNSHSTSDRDWRESE